MKFAIVLPVCYRIKAVKVSELIREARKRRGLTLRLLADQVQVTPGFLHQLEHSRRRLPERLVTPLAQALQMKPGILWRAVLLERAPESVRSGFTPTPCFPRLRTLILERLQLPDSVQLELQSVSVHPFEWDAISVMTSILDEWLINNLHTCHLTLNKYAQMGLLDDDPERRTRRYPSTKYFFLVFQYPEVWEDAIMELLRLELDRKKLWREPGDFKLGYAGDLWKTAQCLRPYAVGIPLRWNSVEEAWERVCQKEVGPFVPKVGRPTDPRRWHDVKFLTREFLLRLSDSRLARDPDTFEKIRQEVVLEFGGEEKTPKEVAHAIKELSKIHDHFTEYKGQVGEVAGLADLLSDPDFQVEAFSQDMETGTSLSLKHLGYDEIAGASRPDTFTGFIKLSPMLEPEFREARRDLFMQGIGLRAYSKAPVMQQVTHAQAKSKKTK